MEIQLNNGKYFSLADIPNSVRNVDLQSIANSLANINRFTGHAGQWSVAQHCLLGCLYLKRFGYPDLAIWQFLLHDKSEALLQDIAAPIKRHLNDYRSIEAAVDKEMEKLFPKAYSTTVEPATLIKETDYDMLKVERALFFSFGTGGERYRPETEQDRKAWGFSIEDAWNLMTALDLYPVAVKLQKMSARQIAELFCMVYSETRHLEKLV